MKKILCLLLIIIFLFSFSACAPKDNTELSTDENPASQSLNSFDLIIKDNILNNWNTYLGINEKIYSTIEWGAIYLKSFCENPDTVSYRRALSATETICATIKNIEIPDLNIPSEDLDLIMKNGTDLSFINAEFSSLSTTASDCIALWENLSRDVATESFWSYGIEYLNKTTDIQLNLTKTNIDILRHTTNYLLLLLEANDHIADISEDYPVIFGKNYNFITNIPDVEKNLSAVLDSYESYLSEYSEIASVQKANIYIMDNAISSKDYDDVYSAALSWAKAESIIPLPSWDQLPVFYSYKTDASGRLLWTSAGDDITDLPPGLIIEYNDITKTDIDEYTELLLSHGYTQQSSENNSENGDIRILKFTQSDIDFSIEWKDNCAIIDISDANIVISPLWYFDYLNK